MIRMCSRTALLSALCLASACTTVAKSAADIEIVSETGTALTVKFTDAGSNHTTMSFGRPTTNDVWISQSQIITSGSPAIVFGNDEPEFAGPSFLRARNLQPEDAVHTFDSDVAGRTFDDITIYRLYAGDSAVALWQEGKVTEIWYVGSMIDEFVILPGAQNTCQQSYERCCRQLDIDPAPENPPFTYPKPSINNCVAVINNCGANYRTAACGCLYYACNYCDENPTICTAIPGLQNDSDNACATHTSLCDPGPPPDPDEKIIDLLGAILDRVQVIIDSLSPIGGGP